MVLLCEQRWFFFRTAGTLCGGSTLKLGELGGRSQCEDCAMTMVLFKSRPGMETRIGCRCIGFLRNLECWELARGQCFPFVAMHQNELMYRSLFGVVNGEASCDNGLVVSYPIRYPILFHIQSYPISYTNRFGRILPKIHPILS